MPEEIIEISHETIGRNILLYPMLRELRVAEIIDSYCKGESEIPIGVVAETIILSRFSQERVPMYKLKEYCSKNGIGALYSIDTTKINDDRTGRALDCMSNSLSEMKAKLIVHCIKVFDITLSEIHTD
jgi:hypothetical protein